jgi:NitT/TauT family transport system permease protein
VLNSLPKIALAPLFLIWLGYGFAANVTIAILVAFFPVVLNTTTGLDAVDEDLLDLVRYLHASKLQVFLKIRIPMSLPYVLSGLKISATLSVVGAIVGEFVASSEGLGFLIKDSQAMMNTPPMFASLILISAIGLGLFASIAVVERVFMPWNRAAEAGGAR